ncbi:hypothetical protein V493_06040 [Pseudogymnoascus sp. VKM F-4281 (FW-2241)]|nr:hypothetical protein V493_06040 [Pseudogymnoascus sp. VKM F-4281 (FW-2241)]
MTLEQYLAHPSRLYGVRDRVALYYVGFEGTRTATWGDSHRARSLNTTAEGAKAQATEQPSTHGGELGGLPHSSKTEGKVDPKNIQRALLQGYRRQAESAMQSPEKKEVYQTVTSTPPLMKAAGPDGIINRAPYVAACTAAKITPPHENIQLEPTSWLLSSALPTVNYYSPQKSG